MIARLILAAGLLLSGAASAAETLELGRFPALSELVVRGENGDPAPRTVTLAVASRMGTDAANPWREVRTVPPGPFAVRVRLGALPVHWQLPVDLADALAVVSAEGKVELAKPRLEMPPHLPAGVRGWFFGPSGAVPLAGFEAVGADDPRVVDGSEAAQSGNDPVLAFGVSLARFQTRLPAGKWRVTLWTERQGDGQDLPAAAPLQIRVNGTQILSADRGRDAWIAETYFARSGDMDPSRTPFEALAARQGGRASGIVTVGNDGALTVELAGQPRIIRHLAAVTAEPADAVPAAEAAVEAVRAARFAEVWPVAVRPPVEQKADRLTVTAPAKAATAPGGAVVLRMTVRSPATVTATPEIVWDGEALPARLLWGQWEWRRTESGMVFSAAHLRGDASAIPLRPELPRNLVMVVRAPLWRKAAPVSGHVRLHMPGRDLDIPFSIDVLPAERPVPAIRVGTFLGFAPYLPNPDQARTQAACDMATLGDLGLSAVAPQVSTDAGQATFLADARAPLNQFSAPVVEHASLRAYAKDHSHWKTATMVAHANAAARDAGLPPMIWSVANGPMRAGETLEAEELAAAIHAIDPAAQLAGHLDDPREAVLLPDLSFVTVSANFGADRAQIEQLRRAGQQPWLHDMPRPRIAAGAYLWRAEAFGLLQGQARPSYGDTAASPMLWPTRGVCAPADLDEDLLAIAEGAEDLRWFGWLEAVEHRKYEAGQLAGKLWGEVPTSWKAAAAISPEQVASWRSRIVALARDFPARPSL
jgi:hypothetical protein